jgi:hypothetical protein
MAGEDEILRFEGGKTTTATLEDNLHTYTGSGLAVGDAVYVSASDTVSLADADGTGIPPIGVVTAVDGSSITVCHSGGIVTGLSGGSPGQDYWLDSGTSSGSTLTTTRPSSNAFLVGVGLTTSALLVLCTPGDMGSNLTQDAVIFVNKAGSDSNDGRSPEQAILTIGAAITAASAQTPSATNKIEIRVLGGEEYSETLALPAYVSLNAPDATLTGRFSSIGDQCRIKIHKIDSPVQAFSGSSSIEFWVEADEVEGGDGTPSPTLQFSGGTVANLKIGKLTAPSGATRALQASNNNTVVRGTIGEINIVGAIEGIQTQNAAGSPEVRLNIGHIDDDGSGTGISVFTGTVDINVLRLDCDTTYTVGASGTLNMFVNELVGTVGTVSGTADVTEAGNIGELTQTNTVYISKSGDDSNSGLTPNLAKLTIASAETAAAGLSPTSGNPVTIHILDAGVYSEDCDLADYTSLFAPDATINQGANISTMAIRSSFVCKRLIGSASIVLTTTNTSDRSWIKLDYVEASASGGAAIRHLGNSILYIDIGHISVATGGIGITVDSGASSPEIYGRVGEIEIAGAGTGIDSENNGSGATGLAVNYIHDGGSGTAIRVTGSSTVANISVDRIDCGTAYSVTDGILYLTAGEVSGTRSSSIVGIARGGVFENIADSVIHTGMRKACRQATTADISNLATGAPNFVDGFAVFTNQRVLVKEQTDGSENGVYIVDSVGTGSNGQWSRVPDFVSGFNSYVSSGDTYYVLIGNLNGGKYWTITSGSGSLINVDTSTITFENVVGGLGGSTGSVGDALLRSDGTGGSTVQAGSTNNNVILSDTGNLSPEDSDGGALGTSSLQWSDLFLASGSVINWDDGNTTLTHGTNTLTFGGASGGYFFINGQVNATGLRMLERASAPTTGAGDGSYWVRDDAPSTPLFTDDTGTDYVLGFPYAYLSETITATATASSARYSPFDSDSYGAFSKTANVTPVGFTYTTSTGVFDVTTTGTYKINITLFTFSSGVPSTMVMDLDVNSSTVWTATTAVHASVDPSERSMCVILDLTAGDDIEFFIEESGAGTLSASAGTTMTIERIA